MPDYQLTVTVVGRDAASGVFRHLGGVFDRLGTITGGIILSRVIMSLAEQFTHLAGSIVNAAAQFQQMEIGLQGLVARELSQLSGGLQTIADVFPQAQVRAHGLMEELSRLSILSPYMVEAVQQVFKMNMAFGFTTDQAFMMTEGLLNMAAGIGASNEMLNRMAYNLAQINLQGKVTKLDVRQLALAGLDLRSVLEYIGKTLDFDGTSLDAFNEAVASGQVTWQQFAELFKKYAEENFGGASERMARTLIGLKSTFHDVWVLTMPKMVGPAIDSITARISKLLDIFLRFREGGVLEEIGQRWKEGVESFFKPLDAAFKLLDQYTGLQDQLKKLVAGDSTIRDSFSSIHESMRQLIPDGDLVKAMVDKVFGPRGVRALTIFRRVTDLVSRGFALLRTIASTVWNRVIQPALSIFSDVVQSKVIPALMGLYEGVRMLITGDFRGADSFFGIQEDDPIVDAILTFRETFIGFAKSVWNWVQTKLIPGLTRLWEWLKINIPKAMATIRDFWVNELMPKWEEIRKWAKETLPKALTTLKDAWEKGLKPGLDTVKKTFDENVLPGFRNLGKFWDEQGEKILGSLRTLGERLLTIGGEGTVGGIQSLGQAFEGATRYILENGDAIAEKIDKITVAIGNFVQWSVDPKTAKVVEFIAIFAGLVVVGAKAAVIIPTVVAAIGALFVAVSATPVILGLAIAALIAYVVAQREVLGTALFQLGFIIKYYFWRILLDASISAQQILDIVFAYVHQWTEVGAQWIEGLWTGITTYWNETFIPAIETEWNTFVAWLKGIMGIASPSTIFDGMGRDLIQGLWDGMVALWNDLKAWAEREFGWLIDLIAKVTETEHSPSEATKEIGRDIVRGLQIGMNEMMPTLKFPFDPGYARGRRGSMINSRLQPVPINIEINIDRVDSQIDVKKMAREVAEEIRYRSR